MASSPWESFLRVTLFPFFLLRRHLPEPVQKLAVSTPIQRVPVMLDVIVDSHLRPGPGSIDADVDMGENATKLIGFDVALLDGLTTLDDLIAPGCD